MLGKAVDNGRKKKEEEEESEYGGWGAQLNTFAFIVL